ncbi:hypothetical protein EW145_g5643 [Phellinidium pouzarii]|uniref:HSA domain-containing protein n=1 Tax=Phellinidium pouzarii TaxID=167371 RepID=A0A4S4KZA6_9AGAM|nr:hypothetical protein EW145_g5643 [Phellinidium pouzarii]
MWIGITELKLIRAFERVEMLKHTGKWSFRQIKKQRVAAGLVKTHWDHVMDEMKWLQVDFREERRWKLALAHEISLWVLEWHEAGTQEKRIKLEICARWRRPDPIDEVPTAEVDVMDASKVSKKRSLVDFVSSDDEQEDDGGDQQGVDDVLRPDAMLSDALDDAQQHAIPVSDNSENSSTRMKMEETDDLSQSTQDANIENTAKTENADAQLALKATSNNLTMDSLPFASASVPETAPKEQKDGWTDEQLKVLRSSLFSLPEETLIVSFDQFVPPSEEDLAQTMKADTDFEKIST